MALYRKYRPATFAQVIGQEHVTVPLSRALESGRINHAYLFSGPRGCGKTSSARILARSLNCEQGPTPTPCGVCKSCVSLAPGGPGNLDVTELDAASHNGVEDMRELRERAFYAPTESRYRVFIIDEAHMITNAGSNALLKIVEEPPEHLIFIFATTEPEHVIGTIRSRTHHYPFRLLTPHDMTTLLTNVCEQEGVTVDPAVYPLVIRAGGGSPRDSLSILDQLLAGSGPEGITYEGALPLLGVTDSSLLDASVAALSTGDAAQMFTTIDQVIEAGHDPRRFATDLLDRMRDLMILQVVPDAFDLGLVSAPADLQPGLIVQAGSLSTGKAAQLAEIINSHLDDLRGATSPRLLLEILCARLLASPAPQAAGTAATPAAPSAASSAPAPAATSTVGANGQRRTLSEMTASLTAAKQQPKPEPEPAVPAAAQQAVAPAPAVQPAAPAAAVQEAAQPAPAPAPTVQPAAPAAPVPAAAQPVAEPQSEAKPEPAVQASAQQAPAPAPVPAAAQPGPAPAPAPTVQPAAPAAPVPAASRPAAEPQPEAKPEPAVQAPAQPPATTSPRVPELDNLISQWGALRSAIANKDGVAGILLSAARVIAVQGDHVLLGHPTGSLVQRLNDPSHRDVISEILSGFLGRTVTVECQIGFAVAAPAAAPTPAAAQPAVPVQPPAQRPSPAEEVSAQLAQQPEEDLPHFSDGVPLPPEPMDEWGAPEPEPEPEPVSSGWGEPVAIPQSAPDPEPEPAPQPVAAVPAPTPAPVAAAPAAPAPAAPVAAAAKSAPGTKAAAPAAQPTGRSGTSLADMLAARAQNATVTAPAQPAAAEPEPADESEEEYMAALSDPENLDHRTGREIAIELVENVLGGRVL